MSNHTSYYVAFSYFHGIGPVRFAALMSHFKSAETAYYASLPQLLSVVNHQVMHKFIMFRKNFNIKQIMQTLEKKQISVICLEDSRYPRSLFETSDPPICLFVRGDWDSLDIENKKRIAVVGTRKPTTYGAEVAKKLSFELACRGIVLVSGMAAGIDSIAHRAALDTGSETVAVLGCGVDIIYPPENHHLYHAIIKSKKGVIVSEFPPGHTVLKGLFVARNRIISGLSLGVIVVEGARTSGALITARYAAEQGRTVFAVPSSILSAMGATPHILIRQGAVLIMGVEDILSELQIKTQGKKNLEKTFILSDDERMIFNHINHEPCSIDELTEKTHLNISAVTGYISSLEIKQVIKKNEEGRYCVKSM